MLLAALSRTVATMVGEGTLAVDLDGQGRSVLKPDVDLRRTVGWFTTVYPVALTCATSDDIQRQAIARRRAQHAECRPALRNRLRIAALPLRADSAVVSAPPRPPTSSSPPLARFLSYRRAGEDVAVQLDTDTALPVRETIPGLGHAIEFRIFRAAGALAPGLVVRHPQGRRGHRAVAGRRVRRMR